MTDPRTRRTRSGRDLTDDDLDAIATEVGKTDYDVEVLKTRHHCRPLLGPGPADVVPVRVNPELRESIEVRAEADHTMTSEIIREALRRFRVPDLKPSDGWEPAAVDHGRKTLARCGRLE